MFLETEKLYFQWKVRTISGGQNGCFQWEVRMILSYLWWQNSFTGSQDNFQQYFWRQNQIFLTGNWDISNQVCGDQPNIFDGTSGQFKLNKMGVFNEKSGQFQSRLLWQTRYFWQEVGTSATVFVETKTGYFKWKVETIPARQNVWFIPRSQDNFQQY